MANWITKKIPSGKYKANGIGKIYRITYPRLKAAKMPDLSKATALKLVKYLESPSAVCRINAQRKLIDGQKVNATIKAALISLTSKKTASVESRVAAIFALEQIYGKAVQKELIAISKVFGKHAKDININSTKSMTGHLLGAAGAIEAISSILSIRNGIIPPTINHTTIDENIDPSLNLTLNKAQKREVNVAMSNTFGFGGHNACVLFKKI